MVERLAARSSASALVVFADRVEISAGGHVMIVLAAEPPFVLHADHMPHQRPIDLPAANQTGETLPVVIPQPFPKSPLQTQFDTEDRRTPALQQ